MRISRRAAPSKLAHRISDLHPPAGEDRGAWSFEVVTEPFTTGCEDADTALERLEDRSRQHEWDLVIGLTELPLRDDDGRYQLVETVVPSWGLVNTVYAFKYARHYYLDEPDAGGIDFKQADPPAYSDFAYLAFTVGMSYAVSETEPTTTAMRRVVLGHTLLSYMFGTGVLTVAINLVLNLG